MDYRHNWEVESCRVDFVWMSLLHMSCYKHSKMTKKKNHRELKKYHAESIGNGDDDLVII